MKLILTAAALAAFAPPAFAQNAGQIERVRGGSSCAGGDLLQGAFSGLEARGLNQSGARLRQADLSLAVMNRTRFSNADLRDVEAYGGKFSGSPSSGVGLTSANTPTAAASPPVVLAQAQSAPAPDLSTPEGLAAYRAQFDLSTREGRAAYRAQLQAEILASERREAQAAQDAAQAGQNAAQAGQNAAQAGQNAAQAGQNAAQAGQNAATAAANAAQAQEDQRRALEAAERALGGASRALGGNTTPSPGSSPSNGSTPRRGGSAPSGGAA